MGGNALVLFGSFDRLPDRQRARGEQHHEPFVGPHLNGGPAVLFSSVEDVRVVLWIIALVLELNDQRVLLARHIPDRLNQITERSVFIEWSAPTNATDLAKLQFAELGVEMGQVAGLFGIQIIGGYFRGLGQAIIYSDDQPPVRSGEIARVESES